jgi:hypothetical protein
MRSSTARSDASPFYDEVSSSSMGHNILVQTTKTVLIRRAQCTWIKDKEMFYSLEEEKCVIFRADCHKKKSASFFEQIVMNHTLNVHERTKARSCEEKIDERTSNGLLKLQK